DVHRPALRPKRARDHGLGAPCGASSRGGIEDDVGMKHAADKIQSRLPRKDLPRWKPKLLDQIVLFPIDGEFDAAAAAHHAAGPATQRDTIAARRAHGI